MYISPSQEITELEIRGSSDPITAETSQNSVKSQEELRRHAFTQFSMKTIIYQRREKIQKSKIVTYYKRMQ